MTYQEMVKLKRSKEYQAADEFILSINDFGFSPKMFAQSITLMHRTLQQSAMRVLIECMKEMVRTMASDDYQYDARNEKAHLLAKRIAESGVLNDTYLPCI